MTNAYKIRLDIDKFLMSLSLSRVDRFYPTALSKYLNISPSEAFNFLLERSGPNDQLTLRWEIRCPDCSRTINTIDNPKALEIDCICGIESEISPTEIYPVFKINSDYKDYIRQENEKKKNKLQLIPRTLDHLVLS